MPLSLTIDAHIIDGVSVHKQYKENIKSINKHVNGFNKMSLYTFIPYDKKLFIKYLTASVVSNNPYVQNYDTKQYITTIYANITAKQYAYLLTIYTLLFNRRNSNIYKNIFDEQILDMELIDYIKHNTITTINNIKQNNHGFNVGNVLSYDTIAQKYTLADANNIETLNIAGVVSEIVSKNIFSLTTGGIVPIKLNINNESGIIYLSETTPGLMVDYTQIQNTLYIPIGIYTNEGVIINMQQGSIGEVMLPYTKDTSIQIDEYTKAELDDLINQILTGGST